MKGWLPVSLGIDPQTPLVSDIPVRWLEFGETPLAEPFLRDTIDKLRTEKPARREIETSLEELLRLARVTGPVTPAGFIFHISHCGSTLIANALKTAGTAVVASEPRTISEVLRPASASMLGSFLSTRWDAVRTGILRAIMTQLAVYRTGEPEPLIIKFASINIRSIALIRRIWPEVPCLVVIREPMEVIVSNKHGGGWMQLKASPEMAMEAFGWRDLPRPVAGMSDEEYAARVIGSFFEAALQSMDEKVMVVDYSQLTKDRLAEIGSLFGVGIDPDGERMQAVLGSYAKDPLQKQPFRDDRLKKQWMATVLLRSAAEVWAVPGYRALTQMARRQEKTTNGQQ